MREHLVLQSVAMAVNKAGVACSSLIPRPSDTHPPKTREKEGLATPVESTQSPGIEGISIFMMKIDRETAT